MSANVSDSLFVSNVYAIYTTRRNGLSVTNSRFILNGYDFYGLLDSPFF